MPDVPFLSMLIVTDRGFPFVLEGGTTATPNELLKEEINSVLNSPREHSPNGNHLRQSNPALHVLDGTVEAPDDVRA